MSLGVFTGEKPWRFNSFKLKRKGGDTIRWYHRNHLEIKNPELDVVNDLGSVRINRSCEVVPRRLLPSEIGDKALYLENQPTLLDLSIYVRV